MISLKRIIENVASEEELQLKTKQLEQSLEQEFPELQDLHLYIKSNGSLFIGSIRVKKESRRQGIGRTVVERIKKFADDNKLTISLAPEAEPRYKEKLDKFYKSLGFVVNKGRHKNYQLSEPFSKTMYRRPGIKEEQTSLISEYVTEPISHLAKYLQSSDEDKAVELAFAFPEYIYQFMGDKISDDVEPVDYVENLYSKDRPTFDAYAKHVFGLFARGIIEKDHYIQPGFPSWNYMDFRSILKNQWLIHFSDDAHSIWRSQKFSIGADDPTALGLTTYIRKEGKKYGGYNFAYDITDYKRYGRGQHGRGWKYGKGAVLFRASGVKVWHDGDEEPQVIFYGETAHDIVLLGQTDPGPWGLENGKTARVIYAGELDEVVEWTISNYSQYRKVLLP